MEEKADVVWGLAQGVDAELAVALAESEDWNDSDSESFGKPVPPPTGGGVEVYGLWIKGGMAGAAWLKIAGANASIPTLVLARARRKMGFTPWMLSQLIGLAKAGGGKRINP